MRILIGSLLALLLTIPATATAQGWVTRSTWSYSGISGAVKTLQWDRIYERTRYRRILKKRGYTDARITGMTTSELSAAALGDRAQPTSSVDASSKTQPREQSRRVATTFQPVKKRLQLATLARSLAKDKPAQKALLKVFEAGIRSYEAQAKKEFRHDVAGAMVFLIGTSLLVLSGQEPSDNGLENVARALQAILDTDEMRRIPRDEKQRFYELMLGYGSYLVASYQSATAAGDTQLVDELRKASRVVVERFLQLDPSKVRITEAGLEQKPGEASEPPAEPATKPATESESGTP
jgi:hypothetical protein